MTQLNSFVLQLKNNLPERKRDLVQRMRNPARATAEKLPGPKTWRQE
ncbi:MAG: hypothetical protein K9K82_08280 [Desulfobacteraceae bacterium]|nr:hypothetical protein [Desulfobacteraceae bacterium]